MVSQIEKFHNKWYKDTPHEAPAPRVVVPPIMEVETNPQVERHVRLFEREYNRRFFDGPTQDDIADWVDTTYEKTKNGEAISENDRASWDFLLNIEHNILFEDNDLLVINKPAGVISHWAPGSMIGAQEVVKYLRGGNVLGVHRLDRPTTGALAYAKNRQSFIDLGVQFADKDSSEMEKKYLTILEGEAPHFSEFVADVPLLAGERNKMRVVGPEEEEVGIKNSLTYFRPLAVFEDYNGSPYTLMNVQIATGRTHQIRVVSAQYLNMPVVGDYLYDPSYSRLTSHVPRLMLHARSLSFSHPATGEKVNIDAPLTADFHTFLNDAKLRKSALDFSLPELLTSK